MLLHLYAFVSIITLFCSLLKINLCWLNISQNPLWWWCLILVVAKFERLSHHCFKSKSSILSDLDITLQTSLKSIDIQKLKALDQTSVPNFVNLCGELWQIKKKMKLKNGFNNKKIKGLGSNFISKLCKCVQRAMAAEAEAAREARAKVIQVKFFLLKIIRWNFRTRLKWSDEHFFLQC